MIDDPPEPDDLLRALGKVAREEREEEDRRIANDPALSRPLDDIERAKIVAALPVPKARAKSRGFPAWIAPAAAALAIAAGVFFFIGRAGSPSLPPYELVVSAGDHDVRGADAAVAEVRTLTPDSKFELLFRPATAVKDVYARGFLVQNGVAKTWNVRPLTSDDGAVRFVGTARTLFPGMTGEVGVLVVVGRGTIGLSEEDAAKIFAGGATDLTVARVRVQLVP
ncbi:MAG: hypothetical protein ACXWP4_06755 [Polyangiales bacterium]